MLLNILFHSALHMPKRGNFDPENTKRKPLVTSEIMFRKPPTAEVFWRIFPMQPVREE
jgi:hypothetical protein